MRPAAALLTAITLLVVGCAQTTYWLKAGGSQDEFNRVQAGCQNESYSLPLSQAQQSAPNYRITAQVDRFGGVRATATPFKAPYQALGDGFSSLAASLDNIAQREQFVRNCMIANGWRNVSSSEVSMTVPTYARVGQDPVSEYEGTATGYPDGAGTINLRGPANSQCVGTFRYAPSFNGGTGVIRCSDGDSASIQFIKLTSSSGYGAGMTEKGRSIRFTYGVAADQRERYLNAK